ncbi:MAG TPA: NnrU family protein [Gemmataceae bacterium]|nr:NnrU family protein [Gemmataceae bacterium]
MARTCGILFGVATHLLFAWTVCRLFPFLQGTSHGLLSHWAGTVVPLPCFLVDSLLALQFAAIHSWLLLPSTRKRIERWLHSEFYGCLFCVVTCLNLLLAIEMWQPHPFVAWQFTGLWRWIIRIAFLACWPVLIYSLNLTGLGYQTGFTPWFAWVRGRKLPRRVFEPRGVYHLLRHPIYLSFLGLVWLTPTVTQDRALLIGLWTGYILLGSWLKDRRLEYYIGEPYRQYQARVAGYPFFFLGPLAKVPASDDAATGATPPRRMAA